MINTNQAIAKPQATLVIGNGISNNKYPKKSIPITEAEISLISLLHIFF
jgi:hypothetical protein